MEASLLSLADRHKARGQTEEHFQVYEPFLSRRQWVDVNRLYFLSCDISLLRHVNNSFSEFETGDSEPPSLRIGETV